MLNALDVSVFQISHGNTPDYVAARKAGIEYVWIRTSYGMKPDSATLAHKLACQRAGIKVGVYHYAIPGGGKARDQAAYFLSRVHTGYDLCPWYDFEHTSIAPKDAVSWSLEFLDEVEKKYRRPWVYTYPGFIQTLGSQASYLKDYGLVIAHYGVSSPTVPPPWLEQELCGWQYAGNDGRLPTATPVPIDLDQIYVDSTHVIAGTRPAYVPRTDMHAIQAVLRRGCYYFGKVDGIKGPKTDVAIRLFQRSAGLSVDGIVGPKTRTALGL